MRLSAIFFFLLLIGCSSPQTSEGQEDSTAAAEELQDFTEEDHEAVDADTTIIDGVKSSFNAAQINNTVAYVYRKGGLLVFGSPTDTTNAIEVLRYGQKIELADKLVNSDVSDKVTMEGFKGRFIKLKGQEGYVFSGYLTNFPLPAENENYVDYCRNHFMLTETPVTITSKVMFDGNYPEWTKNDYRFESGIEVNEDSYYEGGSTTITLPASCTLQEGFLLLKSFSSTSTFDSAFYSFPRSTFSKDVKQFIKANAEMDDAGNPRKIYLSDEGGCYDETYVEKIDGRIVIGSGGGC